MRRILERPAEDPGVRGVNGVEEKADVEAEDDESDGEGDGVREEVEEEMEHCRWVG